MMTREDANNFTREDVLRELELLPVWQLRTPLPVKDALQSSVSSLEPEQSTLTQLQAESGTLNVNEVKAEDVVLALPDALPNFRHLASEDGHWLFVLADAVLNDEEQQLLENIFKAMQLKMKPAALSGNIAEILNTAQPKLLVVMGEATAQAILRSPESLDDMRGKLKQYEGVALIATYDATHLLSHLQDKTKTWSDLRIAMQHMKDLN